MPLRFCQITMYCATCDTACSAIIQPCWHASRVHGNNRASYSYSQIFAVTMKAIARAVIFPWREPIGVQRCAPAISFSRLATKECFLLWRVLPIHVAAQGNPPCLGLGKGP